MQHKSQQGAPCWWRGRKRQSSAGQHATSAACCGGWYVVSLMTDAGPAPQEEFIQGEEEELERLCSMKDHPLLQHMGQHAIGSPGMREALLVRRVKVAAQILHNEYNTHAVAVLSGLMCSHAEESMPASNAAFRQPALAERLRFTKVEEGAVNVHVLRFKLVHEVSRALLDTK